MTSRTRGRLMLCLILGLITLPAEALLLPVARTPDPARRRIGMGGRPVAARSCSRRPPRSTLIRPVYRRAIMRELAPARSVGGLACALPPLSGAASDADAGTGRR